MFVAHRTHGCEELRPEVPVAAFALDGFGQEAGDVVRVCLERRAGLAQRLGFQRASISAPGCTNGASMRGQSNFGKRATVTGLVLVSDRV